MKKTRVTIEYLTGVDVEQSSSATTEGQDSASLIHCLAMIFAGFREEQDAGDIPFALMAALDNMNLYDDAPFVHKLAQAWRQWWGDGPDVKLWDHIESAVQKDSD